jgi:hypothetical protein
MTILATLMAMSIGGYVAMTRGVEFRALHSRLVTSVRKARQTTLYQRAPAGVFISEIVRAELRDPVEFLEGEIVKRTEDTIVFSVTGRAKPAEFPARRLVRMQSATRVRPVGFRYVGMWHLEESDAGFGYLGRPCELQGGEIVGGKEGSAALLNPPGTRGRDRLVCRPSPDDASDPFRLPRGGRVEMWAFRLSDQTDGFLVKRKKSYEIKVLRDGGLEGGPAGETVTAERYVMPLRRWVKVALLFSPDYVEIAVDDVVRGALSREEGTLDPPEKEELVFGEGFSGLIDTIRVQRRVADEAFDLPDGYEIKGPQAVMFDSRGRLDPAAHTAPVTLELVHDDKSLPVTILTSGQIQ